MLRKKYEVDQEFSLMMQLVGDLDDSMSELDKILADEQLFKLMESDLSLRYPKTTKTGRNSTPVEVIFRMLVLKHLRGLSYEKVILNVNESLTLRQFCRIYFHPIPDKSTLIRWSNKISQKTLEKFNQRLTAYATQLQIVRAGHQSLKALIKRDGGGRESDRIYDPDEPAFTIRAFGRKASNHAQPGNAIADGRVVALNARACLRFFGDTETADRIWLPPKKALAQEVVGNGASWVMMKSLIERLGVF